MKERKKPNVALFTLFMTLIFIFITEIIIWGYGSHLIYDAILNYPKGNLVITEAILAVMVLIVMLLFKNSYVFFQKKEKLRTGLFYGLFFIIGSVIFVLIDGLVLGGFKNGLSILNILIGCLLVGICEEFLCRGWLLNEFLERYGDSKKGVWYSIIISGIIFGLIHLGNIFTMGQSIPTTIIQVINAAGIGILFGIIYYKTKNIWSVIILHAFWDFSIFLGELAPVTSKVEMISSFSFIGFFFTILMVLAQLLNVIPYIKDIDAKPKKGTVITCAILGIIFYFLFNIISGLSVNEFGEKFEYGNLSLEHYAVTKDNYNEYSIDYNGNYHFKLTTNESNNLVFTNLETNNFIEIACDSLKDYIIFEDVDYYILGYVDYTKTSNAFLNYIYLKKEEISNDSQYLENIKNNIKKYLLSEESELVIISDYENNKKYLSAYSADYGYYVLTAENQMAILNRD